MIVKHNMYIVSNEPASSFKSLEICREGHGKKKGGILVASYLSVPMLGMLGGGLDICLFRQLSRPRV